MTRNESSSPRLLSYGRHGNPSILRIFTKLLGAPGSPTYRAHGHLPYFEKLKASHTTVCNNDVASLFSAAIMVYAAKDPPHLQVGRSNERSFRPRIFHVFLGV